MNGTTIPAGGSNLIDITSATSDSHNGPARSLLLDSSGAPYIIPENHSVVGAHGSQAMSYSSRTYLASGFTLSLDNLDNSITSVSFDLNGLFVQENVLDTHQLKNAELLSSTRKRL